MSLKAMGWIQNSLGIDMTGEWGKQVNINVGGVMYSCFKGTFKDLMENPIFGPIASGRGKRGEDGAFHIDRDPNTFRHILNYIRCGQLLLPESFDEWDLLLSDAVFYQLPQLEADIQSAFEFQRVMFSRTLPQAVYVYWGPRGTDATSGGSSGHSVPPRAVMIVPALPALTVSPEGEVRYQDSELRSLEELVTTILSSYGYIIQHWNESEGKVFFTLPQRGR